MDKDTRQKLERLTQHARRLLEQEYREQLEGNFDILLDGRIAMAPGGHLSEQDRITWHKLVAAIAHKRATAGNSADAVASYLREAAFYTLNRFVALKLLEARRRVLPSISQGEQSAGFKEFTALAPGLMDLPDKGYRLYVDTVFDEIAREVRVLFDRRDPANLLWPRRNALDALLALINAAEVVSVWEEDETIGWIYQYFNSEDERRQMRAESQSPRNSRELAVRNQFFTPRYVVQFLTDNTLGRTWCEMTRGNTRLANLDYLVKDGDFNERPKKDPRELRILDPACGSGHFLLYAFDLLLTIYEEAWADTEVPASNSATTLRATYPTLVELRRAVPELILRHNLHGVDIDPRAAQIAALALWMRAQRAYNTFGFAASNRSAIARTNVVVAEPMPGDRAMLEEFAATLTPPVLGELFKNMVAEMRLAGDLGTLLRIDEALKESVSKAREQFLAREKELKRGYLPSFEPVPSQREFDLSGISDERFFDSAEERIVAALEDFVARAPSALGVRRQLFAGDAAQGIAFIDLSRKRFDVVLMNPPFGAPSLAAKKEFEQAYPRTKNDIYAAFVERGIELLHPRGLLGAITSRTGFFLSSFQKWREEILLREAPPIVFADLGHGVLDSAMVEVAAYCLQKEPDA